MISNPILHDIIKSELTFRADEISKLCKGHPTLKKSNLFTKSYWQFKEARQEQLNKRYRQADCVWFYDGPENNNYYVVHEVKTGYYEVSEIYEKYKTGMTGQIWILGWKFINDSKADAVKQFGGKVKTIDIEFIKDITICELNAILSGMVV